MDNVISIPKPPVTTLSIDTTIYLGKNQIRRNVGHSVTLYQSPNVTDSFLTLGLGESFVLNKVVKAIYIQTDSPLTVTLGTNVLDVAKLLITDGESASLRILNSGVSEANVHLVYAT